MRVVDSSSALFRRASAAGLRRQEPTILWLPGSNMREWWSLHGRPAVICHNDRWSWVAQGASFDEMRHAPTFESEPEALTALLDWLDTPADRRPDWLLGRRPDWLKRRT